MEHSIHQVVLAGRQQRRLSFYESSGHLPTNLPNTEEDSHCPLLMLNVKHESYECQIYSLWFGPAGNRTRVYRFSSRLFINSTTNRCEFRSRDWYQTQIVTILGKITLFFQRPVKWLACKILFEFVSLNLGQNDYVKKMF